jgi:hypothetical protein
MFLQFLYTLCLIFSMTTYHFQARSQIECEYWPHHVRPSTHPRGSAPFAPAGFREVLYLEFLRMF